MKSLFTLLLAAVLVLSMAACGPQKEEAASASQGSAAVTHPEPVEQAPAEEPDSDIPVKPGAEDEAAPEDSSPSGESQAEEPEYRESPDDDGIVDSRENTEK